MYILKSSVTKISCKYLDPSRLHACYLMTLQRLHNVVLHTSKFHNILQGVHSVITVTYIPKCKHVFLVNSEFCDLYLWKKGTHDWMVAKRSVHRTPNSENKVFLTQVYMYECWLGRL